jgi:D-alanyl-lipoteichoic acid acyltransferase DltB (MBOAT superfamily)
MCWKVEYVLLIVVSTLVAYITAIQMGKHKEESKRKFYFLLSLSVNLGILFFFKYFNFYNDSLRSLFNYFNIFYNVPSFRVLLPVGISFYTFQILSYSIDVYRGKKKPERHLGIFAIYVAFFPQLVAGPIERSTRLLPQFFKKHDFDYQRVTDGLKLMAWGMFKKVVIADRLAIFVDQVYSYPREYQGITLIIATVFFAFQVYCDFSGYTDIALGAARVMGFKLMNNFNHPYISKSLSEVWRRYHISLSSWVRDYVYTPLAINRRNWEKWGIIYALFVTFILIGLWHGAKWGYIIFGILQGIILSCEILTTKARKKVSEKIPSPIYGSLCIIFTFSFWCFSLLFFRANNVSDAFYIAAHLFTGVGDFLINLATNIISLDAQGFKESVRSIFIHQSPWLFLYAVLLIVFLEIIQLIQRHVNIRDLLSEKPVWFRWSVYYILVFSIISLGMWNEQQFIYFQF